MGTIAAKKLNEALAKARNIGLVEETFTLENCTLTIRNLRPDEYVAVLQACQGLNDVDYLNAYQTEHIARAIVAINGVDLRDTKYVTEEESDPNAIERLRTVRVELPAYLLKNVISTWGKEVVYTAYRKFTDVVEQAERKAKEGVTFLLPEETSEEKYRRLLLEAKESESGLPDSLIDHILDENGYMRKSTAEEIKAVMEKTDQLAREAEVAQEPLKAEAGNNMETLVSPAVEAVQQPVNQLPKNPPADPHMTLQRAIEARTKVLPVPEEGVSSKRAAQIAALEADVGLEVPTDIPVAVSEVSREVVELKKQEVVNTKELKAILDQPPRAGINPRFKAPPKV